VITALIDAARYAGLPEDEAIRTVRSGMEAGRGNRAHGKGLKPEQRQALMCLLFLHGRTWRAGRRLPQGSSSPA
jgi:hypothetical protein